MPMILYVYLPCGDEVERWLICSGVSAFPSILWVYLLCRGSNFAKRSYERCEKENGRISAFHSSVPHILCFLLKGGNKSARPTSPKPSCLDTPLTNRENKSKLLSFGISFLSLMNLGLIWLPFKAGLDSLAWLILFSNSVTNHGQECVYDCHLPDCFLHSLMAVITKSGTSKDVVTRKTSFGNLFTLKYIS